MSQATGGRGEGVDVPPPRNPYQARQEAAAAPDLDAAAPYLSSTEVQRLNRKALLFLAGLVLLLLLAAVLIFNSAMSDRPAPERQRSQQQLVIPESPALPDLPPERPIAVAAPEPALPPLPVAQDAPSSSSGDAAGGWAGANVERSLLDRRRGDVAGIHGGGSIAVGPGRMTPDEYARIMSAEGGPPAAAPLSATSGASRRSSAQPLYNPDALLLRGTYIRCVLESRIVTDVPGFTSCVVTEPVYSVNGRKLLLPRGSKVMGRYQSDAIVGRRAAVVWDRITTPNGLDLNMSSPGVDMLGSAGNEGHYSAHWGQRISSALMISMLSDAFKYAGAKHGPQSTTFAEGFAVQNPYESNTARTLERMANMALERNMARPPTVTINQGTMINVYVAQDVDFTAVLR